MPSEIGQAESGKSTVLRNFQLKFTPQQFHIESAAWRAVIDLNFVRSVTFLLSLLHDGSNPPMPSDGRLLPVVELSDDLRRLRVRLSPLRNIEEHLARFLSPDDPDHAAASPSFLSERAFEVNVRSGSKWKALFNQNSAISTKVEMQGYEELKNARRVIEACKDDIVALWNNPAIRASLTDQSVSLEFQSGL